MSQHRKHRKKKKNNLLKLCLDSCDNVCKRHLQLQLFEVDQLDSHQIIMPSWCENHLLVTGPEKFVTEFLEGNTPDPEKVALSFAQAVPLEPNVHFLDACQAWGCKWNAREAILDRIGPKHAEYTFQTPWGPPTAWLHSVSVLYPRVKLVLRYDSPECCFRGALGVCDGEVDEEITEYESDYSDSEDDEFDEDDNGSECDDVSLDDCVPIIDDTNGRSASNVECTSTEANTTAQSNLLSPRLPS